MKTFVDFHIIQDLPPSNVNRDDTGMPKRAVYGGVTRVRVSSQSWKRATREYFTDNLDMSGMGKRTTRVVDIVAQEIVAQAPELEEESRALAESAFEAVRIKLALPKRKNVVENPAKETGYLLFLSNQQVRKIASLVVESARSGQPIEKKAAREAFANENSVDLALFGRMVADNTDLNVDASCQVAHAISTHRAENEFDFFTAVDDGKTSHEDEVDSGAGMLGTIGFTSATLYRYASINVNQLSENLGDNEATMRAIEVFADGFARSMPTGKVNTFANYTLPFVVVATVREDQPISLVSAFEKPVRADAKGYLTESAKRLAAEKVKVEENYGASPVASFVVSLDDFEGIGALGERVVFSDLAEKISETVTPRLPERE